VDECASLFEQSVFGFFDALQREVTISIEPGPLANHKGTRLGFMLLETIEKQMAVAM
jgi:hypothetical protein